MKEIVVKLQTLKKSPTRVYALQEVLELKLFPWALDPRTVRKLIANDRKGLNILQVKITGVGMQRRYALPTAGIINYLKAYGPVMMAMVRKPKQKIYGKRPRKGR